MFDVQREMKIYGIIFPVIDFNDPFIFGRCFYETQGYAKMGNYKGKYGYIGRIHL